MRYGECQPGNATAADLSVKIPAYLLHPAADRPAEFTHRGLEKQERVLALIKQGGAQAVCLGHAKINGGGAQVLVRQS